MNINKNIASALNYEIVVLTLNNKWNVEKNDLILQKKFLKIYNKFKINLNNLSKYNPNLKYIYGELIFKCGSSILRNNQWWLDE
mgnify:CR=1 FL=1